MILINGKNIDFDLFPNNETKMNEKQIDKAVGFEDAHISFKYLLDSDLIQLMLLKKYLDSRGGVSGILTIYYMPYSRMDRSVEGSAFTLKYVADFINSLNFKHVTIIEPHSDVTMGLVNNSVARYVTLDIIEKVKHEIGFADFADVIFFPDAGAQKRYGSKVNAKYQLVGFKHRDFETGKITDLQVVGDVGELLMRKVLIVDDLCSRGGTFILAAQKLRELGAHQIYLLVGHCENTIFQGEIPKSDLIQGVYTTNSIIAYSDLNKIHVYEIERILR